MKLKTRYLKNDWELRVVNHCQQHMRSARTQSLTGAATLTNSLPTSQLQASILEYVIIKVETYPVHNISCQFFFFHLFDTFKLFKNTLTSLALFVSTALALMVIPRIFIILHKETILNGTLAGTELSGSHSVRTTLTAFRHAKSAACLIRTDLRSSHGRDYRDRVRLLLPYPLNGDGVSRQRKCNCDILPNPRGEMQTVRGGAWGQLHLQDTL